VPGGRTATTLTAGVVRMRWLRFAAFAGVAAIVWASYAGLAGYVGGRAFEERPLVALAVGFGVAAAVYAAVELVRYARRRARPDAASASGRGVTSRPHSVSSAVGARSATSLEALVEEPHPLACRQETASTYANSSVRASELERRPVTGPGSAGPLDGYAAAVGGDDPEYVVRDNPVEFRYEILRDGEPVGFIQYWISGERIGLVHTEVLSLAKGQGVGSRLVAGVLDEIRARGLSVIPQCPFVVVYLRRHPEQRDLIDRARTAS
jgi:predicted GNAT family acetyltransferase